LFSRPSPVHGGRLRFRTARGGVLRPADLVERGGRRLVGSRGPCPRRHRRATVPDSWSEWPGLGPRTSSRHGSPRAKRRRTTASPSRGQAFGSSRSATTGLAANWRNSHEPWCEPAVRRGNGGAPRGPPPAGERRGSGRPGGGPPARGRPGLGPRWTRRSRHRGAASCGPAGSTRKACARRPSVLVSGPRGRGSTRDGGPNRRKRASRSRRVARSSAGRGLNGRAARAGPRHHPPVEPPVPPPAGQPGSPWSQQAQKASPASIWHSP